MAEQARKNIFTIDAGRPFAALLAENLLAREDYPLTDMTVLLPTRRACRNFQTSFLQLTHGKPLLLPHIQPLGDVDEQDLSLSLAGSEMLSRILDLPPAISPLRRRILLAKTIDRIEGFTSGFDKAIALADALAQFLDQIIIEGLEFSALETIVPEEFADHWQITLDFLKILGEYWPAILKEEGVIDTAERRNILMRIQADFWAESKPDKPIIAAGSTGSIPATAHLLSVVSSLPNGQVILPGLDQIIDEESWAALEDAHPQYGLKTLLNAIGVERGDVKKLEENTPDHAPFARQKLASEIMRPAQTSHEWQNTYQNDPQSLHSALDNISYIEAENRREEATVIALKFREILENPKKTGTLITPDRKLARQVSAICKRWGIEVDDSAGINLSVSPVGIFANLVCEAALNNMAPVPFMALMKHNHTHCGQEKNAYEQALYDLEKYVLRGVNPGNGFEGMRARISTLKYAPDMTHVLNFIRVIETIMQPFTERMQTGETAFFKDFLHIHLETMEALAASASHTGEEQLWSGEDGEALARLFAELWENADAFQPLDGESYMRILAHFMGGISIRPKYGTHPRLSILGQLEARLIESDFLILSGLNEGIWPPDPGHDSWMSRPMRRKFGLPSLDRAVGLAAHDFVQGFCHSDIVLTRSKTVDGTQQVPARWLQRLETILKSNNLSLKALQNSPLLSWARQIDRAFDTAPLSRPAPKPPASKRPRKLSVTKIETWMKDPYAIYAAHVLRLDKLETLDKPIEAKEKGIILHGIFEKFIRAHKNAMPQNAMPVLRELAEEEIRNFSQEESEWSFWWPRFEKMAGWFIQNEYGWRQSYRNIALEAKGTLEIKTQSASLTLRGIADRIDLHHDGSCAIIDYKTNAGFSAAKMASGENPQLPLEALMLTQNAFAENGIRGKDVSYLGYWCLTGGSEPAKIIALPSQKHADLFDIIQSTQAGLENLIECFADENTPYICLPKSHQTPRFNDYEHLERIKEWAALDDSEQEAAA